jgi:hypothetical protein
LVESDGKCALKLGGVRVQAQRYMSSRQDGIFFPGHIFPSEFRFQVHCFLHSLCRFLVTPPPIPSFSTSFRLHYPDIYVHKQPNDTPTGAFTFVHKCTHACPLAHMQSPHTLSTKRTKHTHHHHYHTPTLNTHTKHTSRAHTHSHTHACGMPCTCSSKRVVCA